MMNHRRCEAPFRSLRRSWLLAGCFLLTASLGSAALRATTVSLVIDYGDGAQLHLPALAWREGMTVLDALVAAQAHPHGVRFSQRGSGTGALVIKIGDLANQGGGPMDKNWLFSVNGKQAAVGVGALTLQTGDAVLWKFQVSDYNSP
jgi:hypothetical protein